MIYNSTQLRNAHSVCLEALKPVGGLYRPYDKISEYHNLSWPPGKGDECWSSANEICPRCLRDRAVIERALSMETRLVPLVLEDNTKSFLAPKESRRKPNYYLKVPWDKRGGKPELPQGANVLVDRLLNSGSVDTDFGGPAAEHCLRG